MSTPQPKIPRRRLPKILAVTGLATLLLIAGVYGLLQTPAGQRLAGHVATRLLSDPGKEDIRIPRLVVRSAGRFEIPELALADDRGAWLVANDITVRWRPRRLLKGRLEIAALTVDRIAMTRRPAEEPQPDAAPLLPSLPGDIGTVSIAALRLDEAVLGTAATYRVKGRGPITEAGSVDFELAADRIDRAGDAIELSLQFTPAKRHLKVRLFAREDRGGVLASALGIASRDRLAISLYGAGPVGAWKGTVDAKMGGNAIVRAALSLDGVKDSAWRYRIDGRLDVKRFIADSLPAVLRSVAAFRLDGHWRRDADRIDVDAARIANQAGALELTGRIALDTSRIAGTARLAVSDGAWIGALSGDAVTVERLSAEGSFEGPIHGPGLRAAADLSGLRSRQFAASSARLSVMLKAAGKETGSRRRFDLGLASGSLDHAEPVLDALIGAVAELELSGDIDLATGRAAGLNGRLKGAASTLLIRDGSVDPVTPAAHLTVEASLTDLARLDEWIGAGLAGRVKASGRLEIAGSRFTAKLSGQAETFTTGIASIDALTGPTPAFEGTVESRPAGPVDVSDFKLSGRSLVASGRASLDPAKATVGAEYRIEIADLTGLSEPAGMALRGHVVAEGTARGPMADPGIALTFEAAGLPFPDPFAGSLAGRITAETVVSAPKGAIAATARTSDADVVASLDYRLVEAKALRLTEIAVRGAGAELSGALTVPLDGAPVHGAISGRSDDLATLSSVVPVALGGSARFVADLAGAADRQTARLRVEAKSLRVGSEARARSASCTVRLDSLGADAKGGTACEGRAVRVGGWASESVSVTADGGMSSIAFTATAKGKSPVEQTISAAGAWRRADGGSTVELAKLEGSVAGQPIRLAAPTIVALTADRLDLQPTRLTLGKGRLDVRVRRDGDALDGRLQVARAPLSLVGAIVPRFAAAGDLDVEATLGGTTRRPTLAFSLALAQVTVEESGGPGTQPMSGEIKGNYGDGTLSVESRLRGSGEDGVGDQMLEARATLPLEVTLAPASLILHRNRSLAADADWRGDLAYISEIVPMPGNTFAGAARLRLKLAGTAGDPRLSGTLRVENGRFENLFAGLVLSDIAIEAEAIGERVVLRRVEASDGRRGRLTGTGAIAMSAAKDFPVDLKLSIAHAALVRRDEVTAVLNGQIALTGGLRDLVLTGTIESEKVDWLLGQPLPPSVVDLEVKEIEGGKTPTTKTSEPETRPSRIGMNLVLEMPGRVFVRGRGLDSEWKGTLKIGGTVEEPLVEGKLEPVRGQFEFAGKAFKLAGNQVRFVPGRKIDADLDIIAAHDGKAVKAELVVTGKASRPSVALRSTPPLPRDEIIARVLFGKGVGQLSQSEAAQLGIAVAARASESGGLGVIGSVRRALGLDVLRAGTDDNGGASVTAGKYIAEGVFVGVEQGAGADTGEVKVEAEILPNVSVKSGVGTDSQGNVGIQFKWDY